VKVARSKFCTWKLAALRSMSFAGNTRYTFVGNEGRAGWRGD
jgi:hypothetical protein